MASPSVAYHAPTVFLGTNGGTSSGVTTSGNHITVFMDTSTYTGGVPPTLIDNKGNTFSLIIQNIANGDTFQFVYVAENATTGAGHTFTCLQTALSPSINVICLSGAATSKSVGRTRLNFIKNSNSTSISAGSITPYTDANIILAYVTTYTSGTTQTVDSGFTPLDNVGIGASLAQATAYFQQATSAAINPTWSWTPAQLYSNAITIEVASAPVPYKTVNYSVLGSGGDISPSLTAQVVFSATMGTDLSYGSTHKTCGGTAADSSHIVLTGETIGCVGHLITDDTRGANICYISAFNVGTQVATVTSLIGTPTASATFNATPQSGDGYTIYPSIVKFTWGTPSGGHTIWPGAYTPNDNTGWLKFDSSIVTNPQSYIWVKGAGTRVYSRDVGGSWTDGVGPICVSNQGNHTAIWHIDCDNILFEDVDSWDIGGQGPPAGNGCWLSTLNAPFANVLWRRCVLRGDDFSYDTDHSPVAYHDPRNSGHKYQASLLIGTAFYPIGHMPPGTATNCTIVSTGNVVTTAGVGGMAAGSPVLHLVSTAGLALGNTVGLAPWVAHPNIPDNTTLLSIDSGTQVTLNKNATGAGVIAGDTVYVGPYGLADNNTMVLNHCAVFGITKINGIFTNTAVDYAVGSPAGTTAMLYANQFAVASAAGAGAIDLRPKAGHGLGIGTGLSGTDLYGNAFVDSVGAIQFQASVVTAALTGRIQGTVLAKASPNAIAAIKARALAMFGERALASGNVHLQARALAAIMGHDAITANVTLASVSGQSHASVTGRAGMTAQSTLTSAPVSGHTLAGVTGRASITAQSTLASVAGRLMAKLSMSGAPLSGLLSLGKPVNANAATLAAITRLVVMNPSYLALNAAPQRLGATRAGETVSRGADFTKALAIGDTILSVIGVTISRRDAQSLTAHDLTVTPITAPGPWIVGNSVNWWLQSGPQIASAGAVDYVITATIVTASGEVIMRDMYILVEQGLG